MKAAQVCLMALIVFFGNSELAAGNAKVSVRQNDDLREEVRRLRQDLEATRYDLRTLGSGIIPVGFTYIQYHNQSPPSDIWPQLTWDEVTGDYGGLFFRASGGGSAGWGVTQDACAPRVTNFEYGSKLKSYYPQSVNLPLGAWSEFSKNGYYYETNGDWTAEGARFFTTDCEVRPKNQEIRIWVRTA